jgi:CheY-like chemotaxis protein
LPLCQGGLEEMIDLVKASPFVVLMDVRLDGDNGFDICHLFKHHTFFADVPVVFMSGLIGEDDILLAYKAGAYDYLPKPVTLKTLSAKCKLIRKFVHHTADLKSQVSTIESVAMNAMTTSSGLGGILRFHEKIAQILGLVCRAGLFCIVLIWIAIHYQSAWFSVVTPVTLVAVILVAALIGYSTANIRAQNLYKPVIQRL